MVPAKMSFTILEYLGIWRPSSCISKWEIRFYNIYNCFMLIFLYIIGLSFFISICLHFDNLDLFTENMFFFSATFAVSFKSTYICVYRQDIIAFKNMFFQRNCIPRDVNEMAIRRKFYNIDRLNSRIFLIIVFLTAIVILAIPLAKGKNVCLPLRHWVPYNLNSRVAFWMTYIYQASALLLAALLFVAHESLAAIMMQQICAQLEMIMYRLLKIPQLLKKENDENNIYRRESNLFQDCIAHHVFIFKIQEKLNELFGIMVFWQFFATTINLCTVIYQLSKLSVSNLKFWSMTSVLICFIWQILTYCWYGDEMIEKSLAISDTVYNMNWDILNEKTKKNLIIIMVRAKRPMKFIGGSIFSMSVETFMKILKTSYSAFSLLRNS